MIVTKNKHREEKRERKRKKERKRKERKKKEEIIDNLEENRKYKHL